MGLSLLAGYLVFVGWLTLRPISVPWVAPANLELFATIEPELRQGLPHALQSLGGDLLLLAPLGVLLPLASGLLGSRAGSFFRTVIAAGMLACALEALGSSVPGQMANVDSVLLHTAGAAACHVLLYPLVRALFRRVDALPKVRALPIREPSQGSPLKSTRVRLAPGVDVSRGTAPYV